MADTDPQALRADEKVLEKSIKKPLPTKKPSSSDYIELRLPKLTFKETPLSPLWIIVLLIFSFLLGMLTTKVQYLEREKNTSSALAASNQTTQNAPSKITEEGIKSWAKELGLNVNKFNSCYSDKRYTQVIEDDIKAATAVDVTATPTFFVNGHKLVGALPASIIKKVIDFELQNGDWENPQALVNDSETAAFVDGSEQNGEFGKTAQDVDEGRLVMGTTSAPVTMIEFSDFECPFCRRFYENSFGTIKKEYIDTGKVKFAYRHLPLSIHPFARPFAKASECANEQGKFWEMHELIFRKQAAA